MVSFTFFNSTSNSSLIPIVSTIGTPAFALAFGTLLFPFVVGAFGFGCMFYMTEIVCRSIREGRAPRNAPDAPIGPTMAHPIGLLTEDDLERGFFLF